MNATSWLSEEVSGEFTAARLNDPRRTRRLVEIAGRLSRDPTASFPDAFGSSAELEGLYRFLRNEAFGWEDVLRPHVEATGRRAAQVGECLAIHDTTEFVFSGKRAGLGRTSSSAQGFFGHLTLLVGTDPARTPLGVAGLEQYARTGRKGRRSVFERRDEASSEGRRWLRGAERVEKLRSGRFECIHIADREGDTFHFLSGMVDLGARFVIRVSQDRRVVDEDGEFMRLHELVLGLKPKTSYKIELSARAKGVNPKMERSHPSRRQRVATVAIAAIETTVAVPTERRRAPDLQLSVVRVWEEHPPPGEPPVEWILWTTEPVKTVKQMRQVVEYYRARWVIEEYFKALKTGCQFERRQLESFGTLTTALALFAPIAWKLLLARSIARNRPDCSPTAVLSPIQVQYLEKKYGKPLRTARAALLAMAQLGGHLTQNGEPGWLTLGRGYEKLLEGEAFLRVLSQPMTSDQS